VKKRNPPSDLKHLPEQPPALTLADVLKVVETAPAPSPTRRRDMISALRSVGRILEQDLAVIPAERRALIEVLRRVHAGRAGISVKRWSNIRADLSAALDLAKGIIGAYRRQP